MSTRGCVKIIELGVFDHHEEFCSSPVEERVKHAMRMQLQMKMMMEKLKEDNKRRRQEIVEMFASLRSAVDSSESDALLKFDSSVSNTEKILTAEYETWQVQSQQAVVQMRVGMTGAVEEQVTLLSSSPKEVIVRCLSADVDILKRMIAGFWTVVITDTNARIEDEIIHSAGGDDGDGDGVIALFRSMEQTLVNMFALSQKFVADAGTLETRRRAVQSRKRLEWYRTRAATPRREPFAFEVVTRCESRCDPGGMATNRSGTMVAVSDRHVGCVTLYDLSTFNVVESFGRCGRGPGYFNDPRGICFGWTQDSLFVAEYRSGSVQEVTLTGKHVRYIGMEFSTTMPIAVDVNADVIVVGQHGGGVCIFEYESGARIRSLHSTMNVQHLKFSLDFKYVVVALAPTFGPLCGKHNVCILSDVGDIVKMYTVMPQHVRSLCFLASGDLAVFDADNCKLTLNFCDVDVVSSKRAKQTGKFVVNAPFDMFQNVALCAVGDFVIAATGFELVVFG